MISIANIKSFLRKDPGLILMGLFFILAVFFRTYRADQLLGFYYDQGRDALKVMDILNFKDFPAVGPTTGISGVFLGPFWFYFLAPFYFLSGGNPVFPAVFVGFLDALSVLLFYFLGKNFLGRKEGIIASFLWAISYYLIRSARWFSNPSPLPFFTLLLLFSLAKWLIEKRENWMVLVSLFIAISLQLEAASAIFYFPAITILVLVFKLNVKKLIKSRFFTLSIFIFVLFLLPQLFFDLKNNFLISKNIVGFFAGSINTNSGKSWTVPSKELLFKKIANYYDIFFVNLDPNFRFPKLALGIIFIFGLFFSKFRKGNEFLKMCFVFLAVPLFLLLFFVGNYGNFYSYYLTGFFPIFAILFAVAINTFGSLLTIILLFLFAFENLKLSYFFVIAGVDGSAHITIGNQKQVIDWICKDSNGLPFNVDTYVPPVIPYAWDYLWKWYGLKKKCLPEQEKKPLLYTVWETNLNQPQFLREWLERQDGIGKIEKEVKFGGIGVERRWRY